MQQNDSDKNDALKIKLLEANYETILRQYEEAYQNYVQFIKNVDSDASGNTKEYAQLKGRSFWGTAGLDQTTANSISECEDMCIQDDKCTGATFNPDKHYCWTRSGDAQVSTGLDSDVALIPKDRELLTQLKFYNFQLIQINHQLSAFYANSQKSSKDQEQEQQEKHALLVEYTTALQEEKIQLEAETQRVETIHATKNTQDHVAATGYTQFRFCMLIACILFILSMKMAFSDGESGNTSIIVPIIILLLLAASFALRSPQGFMALGLIFIIIIAVKLLNK